MLAKQFGWGEDWDEIEKRALAELVPTAVAGSAGLTTSQRRRLSGQPPLGLRHRTDMLVTGG